MKAIITGVSAIALLTAVSLASAEEASGLIIAVDPDQRIITLDDGQNYTLAEGVEIDGLEPGSEVLVSFETSGDDKVVMEIAPVQ